MPNKSLIPPPSAEEAGQWAKQLIELVMTCFFYCVSPTGPDTVGVTSKIIKLESGTVFISQSFCFCENLPFLLQRNQLTSLASHQK